MIPPQYVDAGNAGPPFTMEELGFAWPNDWGAFNPSSIPVWLQERSLTDLGLPVNGSDGVFLRLGNQHGWSGDLPSLPEAW